MPDLKVFLGVVGKDPHEVVPAVVPGFITAQRTGRPTAPEWVRVGSAGATRLGAGGNP